MTLGRCQVRLEAFQILTVPSKRTKPCKLELWLNAFLLTGLPFMHGDQMGRMAFVLGVSNNLVGCTLNKISKEHVDAPGNLTEAHSEQ